MLDRKKSVAKREDNLNIFQVMFLVFFCAAPMVLFFFLLAFSLHELGNRILVLGLILAILSSYILMTIVRNNRRFFLYLTSGVYLFLFLIWLFEPVTGITIF